MTRRSLVVAVTAAVVFLSLSPIASADPGRTGSFVLFSGQSLEFRRDLASSLTLWHFEKSFFIPRMRKGPALAVGFGGKSRGGTWDVSYLRSSQTVSFEDGTRTATFQAIEINGRSFFLKKLFVHPYFLGGITFPFLRVDGGAFYQGKTLNAAYFGAGLNIGGGFLFEIGPTVLVNAGVIYRWIGFLYAYGEGKGRDINNLRVGYLGPEFGRLLRTDMLTFTIGLGFVL